MTRRIADRIISLILIVFSITLYILIPLEIKIVPATVGMTGRFFPYVTVIGILAMSILLFINSFRNKDQKTDKILPKMDKSARFGVSGLLLIIFGYICLIMR